MNHPDLATTTAVSRARQIAAEAESKAVDAALLELVTDLHAMLFPERYPRGRQPDHVYWSSGGRGGSDVFEWSADTIEWVAAWCERQLSELDPGRGGRSTIASS